QTWPGYAPPPASGPYAGEPDSAAYNYDRAYRHFLNSPYNYRTLSSLSRGYWADYPTPYGREGYYREPGYEHQRITPYGFESRGYVPGYGAYRATPWGLQGYEVPGYRYDSGVPSRWR